VLVAALAAVVAACGDHRPFGSAGRYAIAARDMADGGDWIVPHLCGVAYVEKPILVFWLGALACKAFGHSWLALHAPAAVAMLVVLLATFAIGARLRTREVGVGAALMLLDPVLVVAMATTLSTDPILSACLAVAWWAFLRFDEEERTRHRLAFWAALGLGVLAKGPIALVLPAVALAGFALLTGGPRALPRLARRLGLVTGAAIVLAIALPWNVAIARADPRFPGFLYLRNTFQAFYDAEVHHPGPWWYYGPALLLLLAPFSPWLLPAAAIGGARAWRARRDPAARRRVALLAIALFPLLFLSLSASKLAAYPMPLLPAIALLGAEVLGEWDARRSRLASGSLLGVALLLLVALAAGVAAFVVDPVHLPGKLATLRARFVVDPALGATLFVLAGAIVLTIVFAARRRLVAGLASLGGGMTAAVALLLPVADHVAPELDPGPVVRALHAARAPGEPIYLHASFVQEYPLQIGVGERMRIVEHARELGVGHFVEVRGPEVPLPPSPDDVDGEMLPDHPWLATFSALAEAWRGPGRVWFLCDDRVAAYLRTIGLEPTELARAGKLRLYSNRR
jgi:4-amino-4-deoxy-L-arabinose transferase-like glycosyltransferase